MLVKEILDVAKSALAQNGIEESELDAKLLMCHMLGIDQTKLFMNWGRELSQHQCEIYFELLDRRNARIPLQYIVGFQNFMGEDFEVREGVLIPRPETELLVNLAFEKLKGYKKPKVLDLCTGSGIIAITVAKNIEKAKVTASDLSADAVNLAKDNAKRLHADIEVKTGDLFEPFCGKFTNKKFDMIISNPPYIKTDDIETLQIEVREHEPHMALDGGEDGLDFYKRILENAYKYLTKNGTLLMEIGCDQKEAIIDIAKGLENYRNIEVQKDYAGHDRIFYCEKF